MARKRSYPKREDGVERAAVAIWVHLTREQVAAIENLANSVGTALSFHELLSKMVEDAIEKAIASKAKDLPITRELWAWKLAKQKSN